MTAARLDGIFAVKLPMRDLAVSRAGYERLFDLRCVLSSLTTTAWSAGLHTRFRACPASVLRYGNVRTSPGSPDSIQ